jgi:NitT/TauT family transport system ATP-binding protein
MPFLRVEKLSKSYHKSGESSERLDVLDNLDFSIERSERIAVFGPNGCGKTTLLQIIGGLARPDSGQIVFESKVADPVLRAGFVFQNYRETLLPWRRNLDNIAFPLELGGIGKEERLLRVRALLESLKIEIPERGYPYQLSGGQQQLLALARALAQSPELLLMDEPFNSLDYETRLKMQQKVLDVWAHCRSTLLFVSHDLEEAIFLADRMILLSPLPARVLEIIEVDLPFPRKSSVLESDRFFRIKARALKIFREALEL